MNLNVFLWSLTCIRLTTHPDTKELKANVHRVLAENIACGLDPEKATLYCQSHVHETSELYLYLNMLAYKGELEKTVTFKDKVRQQPENVNAGLLTYPVLQAADIIFTVHHWFLLVKTRNNTWKWQEILQNGLIIVTVKFFLNPMHLTIVKHLVKVPSLDGSG